MLFAGYFGLYTRSKFNVNYIELSFLKYNFFNIEKNLVQRTVALIVFLVRQGSFKSASKLTVQIASM